MPDCLRASVDNGPFLVFLESESEPEYRNRRFKPSTYISINRGTGGTVWYYVHAENALFSCQNVNCFT